MDRKPLLEETFIVSWVGLSNKTSACRVKLYDNELLLFILNKANISPRRWLLNWLWRTREDNTSHIFERVDLNDVIGCRCLSADSPSLEIYSYPKSETNKGARYCQKLTLFYDSVNTSPEKSIEILMRWKQLISYLLIIRPTIVNQQPVVPDEALINSFISGKTNDLPVKRRKFLILLNPVGGPSQGEYMFETFVSKMLKEAEIDYTLIKTEHCGHAKSFVAQHTDLFDYDGIVTASGDGLFYEVINGLFSRSDWQETLRIPLGLIPFGSGNCLSAMICFIFGETVCPNHVCQSTFLLTKSLKPKPFDLIAVDTVDGRLYSFLWLAWGLVADVDIESERLRYLGANRFTVLAIIRTLALRKYRGRISFLPASSDASINQQQSEKHNNCMKSVESPALILPPLNEPVPDNWVTIEGEFVNVLATHSTHLSCISLLNSSIRLNDGCIWLMVNRTPAATRFSMAKLLLNIDESHGVPESQATEWYRVRAFRIEPAPPTSSNGHILTVDGERISYGPVQGQILPEAAFLL